MREFIGDSISIDGRMIGYRIVTVSDYLNEKGLSEEEIEDFANNTPEIHQLINQIIAVKQSCWLLRRTSHSCGSLSYDMLELKEKLMSELKEKHGYNFDDVLMEEHCSS